MKKLLKTALLAAVMFPALTACPQVEPIDEETVIIENAITARGQAGISLVNLASSTGMTKDVPLKTSVEVDGYKYKMEYTLNALFEYDRNWVYIEDGSAGKVLKCQQPGQSDLPADNNNFAIYALTVTPIFTGYVTDFVAPAGLTTTDTFVNKKYTDLKQKYNVRVNAGITLTLDNASQLYGNNQLKNNETRVIVHGKYAGALVQADKFDASSSKFCLYFDNGAYSFVAYDESVQAIPSNLVVGQVYKVYGVYSNYYNTIEVKNYVISEPDSGVTVAEPVKTEITGSNLKDYNHASTTSVVTNATITKVEVGYGSGFEHGKTKVSVYCNISGATNDNGTLKDELYAYVHQFDTAEDYASWANCFDATNPATYVGAKVSFEGRAYWYSGYPAFYHSHVTSFTAPTAA